MMHIIMLPSCINIPLDIIAYSHGGLALDMTLQLMQALTRMAPTYHHDFTNQMTYQDLRLKLTPITLT